MWVNKDMFGGKGYTDAAVDLETNLIACAEGQRPCIGAAQPPAAVTGKKTRRFCDAISSRTIRPSSGECYTQEQRQTQAYSCDNVDLGEPDENTISHEEFERSISRTLCLQHPR